MTKTGILHVVLAAGLAGVLASCGGKSKSGAFELKGNFKNSNGETIFLEKLNSTKPVVVDSAVVDNNGDFEFASYVPKIGFYRIKVNEQNFAMLVLDSADKVTVTGDIKDLGNTYKAEGSAETSLFIDYNELAKQRDIRLDSLNKAFQMLMEGYQMDKKRMDSLSAVFEAPYNAIVGAANEKIVGMIKANANKYSSLMPIQALDPDTYMDVYTMLDEGLTKKFPNDKNVKMFHEVVSRSLATRMGQVAPEINLPTPNGDKLALSSLRGKVVLVDFWASWCGPCRKEMPNVVAAYKKYKDKGFEIYGVSLDMDKDRWLEAIAKDGITWPQVSDLKQWGSDVVPLYSITGIPFTVLLDREGKIVAKNLRGQELEETLAEILK